MTKEECIKNRLPYFEDDGRMINTDRFSDAARYFKEHKKYCKYERGSHEFINFWKSEEEKILNGVKLGQIGITGYNYFYLNYNPISFKYNNYNKTKITGTQKKKKDFPLFFDSDRTFFWYVDICIDGIVKAVTGEYKECTHEEKCDMLKYLRLMVDIPDQIELKSEIIETLDGGFDVCVGKKRRGGFTYKIVSIITRDFVFLKDVFMSMGAYDETSIKGEDKAFRFFNNNIEFLNEHTEFQSSRSIRKMTDGIIRNSILERGTDGKMQEKGRKNTVQIVTYGKDSRKLKGADIWKFFVDEAGDFGKKPNELKKLLTSNESAMSEGTSTKTGTGFIVGTVGVLDERSIDYIDFNRNPLAYNFLPIRDMEPGKAGRLIGYFHSAMFNNPSAMDEWGNSNIEQAKKIYLDKIQRMRDLGKPEEEIVHYTTDNPLYHSHAFEKVSTHFFMESIDHIERAVRKYCNREWRDNNTYGEVALRNSPNGVFSIKKNLNKAIYTYNTKSLPSKEGCVYIYEPCMPNSTEDTYYIGYDPVHSEGLGSSLVGICVVKANTTIGDPRRWYVAEFIGRRRSVSEHDEIAMFMSMYYNNAKIMYENETGATHNYFFRERKIHLLDKQPNSYFKGININVRIDRKTGCHIKGTNRIPVAKDTRDFLQEYFYYDNDGTPISRIETLESQRLLEEIYNFDLKNGNFDLFSALQQAVVGIKNRETNMINFSTEEDIDKKQLDYIISSLNKTTI